MEPPPPAITEATLAAFSDAWNRHDIDALMSLHERRLRVPDRCRCRGLRHAPQRRCRRAPGLCRRLAGRARRPVDATACTSCMGDFGISQWTFTGTAADGSRIEVDGVDVFTFRDGKIQLQERVPQGPAEPACGRYARAHESRRRRRASAPAARSATTRCYDPLVAPDPGIGRAYAPTYWVASAGTPPEDDGPVLHDMDVDVAIIGSGATGMSTALYLAQEHGIAGGGARSQPGRVGLLQPQRRPGPECQRPAEALAMDRALGPGRGQASSTPRSAAASRTSAS